MVRAEQVIRRRQPFVEISLNDRNGNASRLDDALKAVIARAEVEGLFLEHRRHAPAEGKKPGMREHGQLEFSVAVHELRVGEKVEPVFDRLVEGAEQAVVGEGSAELGDEHVAHLPAVAHFFGHDAHQAEVVVARGRRLEQPPLLLHGREFGVSLIDDQILRRVADALVGDVHYGLPAQLPMVVAKLDFGTDLAVFGLEAVFLELRRVETNVLLPAVKVINPVVEIGNPQHKGTAFSRG